MKGKKLHKSDKNKADWSPLALLGLHHKYSKTRILIMKNAMKRLFSLTLIVLVTMVNANADNHLLVAKITGKRSFQIAVRNVVGQAQLKIVDRKGTILHNSFVDHGGSYIRKFDVSSLPADTYFLVIEDE